MKLVGSGGPYRYENIYTRGDLSAWPQRVRRLSPSINSDDNFLDKLGLETYIAFKRTSSSTPKGSRTWKEMYEFFRRNPEAYDLHYHQRSNVETTFHMPKQRFGHFTRHFTTNQNEIKTRILCHNLCILIQEPAERGILRHFESCVKTLGPV
jgi:hypothetical protein